MVWGYFWLLESEMLWWICALSLCVCGSEGEEERTVSLSMMNRLVISAMFDIILGMWSWVMCYFAEEFGILRNWGSPALQEEGNRKAFIEAEMDWIFFSIFMGIKMGNILIFLLCPSFLPQWRNFSLPTLSKLINMNIWLWIVYFLLLIIYTLNMLTIWFISLGECLGLLRLYSYSLLPTLSDLSFHRYLDR